MAMSMARRPGVDEAKVRGLLDQAAASEEPPSRVDVEFARSRGRRKLRWRRAGLAGASAAAVVAVAVGVAATSGSGGTAAGRGRTPEAHGPVTAPSRFDPLHPYATFGWLPAGESLTYGTTSTNDVELTAGTGPAWQLQVYAAGFCDLTSGQVLRQLGRHQQPQLDCSKSVNGAAYQVTSVAAARVGGHVAFWTADQTYLVWRYANGGWAALTSPVKDAPGVALKVARGVRFGAVGPPIKFQLQAVSMPAGWAILLVHFWPNAGVLRGFQYVLGRTGADASGAIFSAGPATGLSSCYPGRDSPLETINGYQVVVNHYPAADGVPPGLRVCAPDADGVAVIVSTSGSHASPDAVSIFRRHIRILGTNPADWTTEPVG
jgi:hypothetical protein